MSEELTWLSAGELRALIGRGDVSSVEVVDHFLNRIEKLNPQLRAFAHLDPDTVRRQAEVADAARQRGEALGPLHGVPVSVKENLAVAGLPYSFPRKGESGISQYDAIAVERLRAAGAIVVGTNTMQGTGGAATAQTNPEAALMSSYNWDREARNPWDTGRVPGWSSSGGAAAVAAGLLPVAIGSDGGGSTRLPAAYSGIFGVHPTRGLIPHVNYARPSLRFSATNGPLTRSARDAALVTQVLAGPDGRDYICITDEPGDYLAALTDGIAGMRLAWTDDFGYASREASAESARVIELVRQSAFRLRDLGATVASTDQTWEPANRGGGPAPGEPEVYSIDVGSGKAPAIPVDPAEYKHAAEWRARNLDGFRTLFREYDLLLSVTSQHIAPTVSTWDENWTARPAEYAVTYTSHTVLCNLLGLPAVSVPCGFIDDMPVGLQIIGPPRAEAQIFRLASAFQQAFPRREHPPMS
ncbi:amidase [Nocardia miyunensis]|uniref:amidase n=1 Tax=Nocardia miyunensis TaxID=282684 RepID=UPI000831C9C0|nr:amidase [Nocardia miyunensis]